MNLREACGVVGEVAETERGGYEVDGIIGEGEGHGVALCPADIRACIFVLGEMEHLRRKVEADEGFCFWVCGALGEESGGEVARAAADVEHARFGAGEDCIECGCGSAPPSAIESERKQMVEAIVGWGDGAEEFADVCCGLWLRVLCCGPCACGVLLAANRRAHRVAPLRWDCGLRASSRIWCAASSSSRSVTSRTIVTLPMPVGRTKERAPLRFFLSLAVSAMRCSASAR